jgi:hypothetical protein
MTKAHILAMFGASAMAAAVLVVSQASVATAAPAPKVIISHIDQDDVVEGEASSVVISVSSNALEAHLAHGDFADETLIPGSVDCAAPAI